MTRFTSSLTSQNVDHRRVVAAQRVGVVLVQLGTPTAPTAAAVRVYLKEFLSDPRVVEIPRLLWQVILRGIILNLRPAKSAAKYAAIWTPEGSPLMVHSLAQTALMKDYFERAGVNVSVRLAMRYGGDGEASIPATLQAMRKDGIDHILVLPMYPQYAAATTASVFDAVFDEIRRWRNAPALRTVRNFHDQAFYIESLAEQVRAHWAVHGKADKLLLSFHGVPRRSLELGDPYHCECLKTGRLLGEALGLGADQYLVTFQSRFGKAKWLEPYTAGSVRQLAQQGLKSLDVFCPGFVVDCLETLEEIAMEVKADFLAAGGEVFRYIPCLNDSASFSRGLSGLVQQQLQGWPLVAQAGATSTSATTQAAGDSDELRGQRAQALGAPS